MTTTKPPPTIGQPNRFKGPVWAVTAFAVILVVGGLYFAFRGNDSQIVDQTSVPTPTTVAEPMPTTVAPDVEAMTDLEVIEAGAAAFYSGDAEKAAALFDLPDRTDQQIREEAAYQAAIGGRLELSCTETLPELFRCRTLYENAMTDAAGLDGAEDPWPVAVEDGVITKFGFTEHSGSLKQMGTFLAMQGLLEDYENCTSGPFAEACATIQLENLDAWVEWREALDPVDLVEFAMEAWYGGDCEAALYVAPFWSSAQTPPTEACAPPTGLANEYEWILGAEVSIDGCSEPTPAFWGVSIFCDVHYSNVMRSAVGQPPVVTNVEFRVDADGGELGMNNEVDPWYLPDYPVDTELRESFRQFAQGGELADAYAAASCNERTPDCAILIRDNLDEWAAWHQANR
jgi:hypothetical protein